MIDRVRYLGECYIIRGHITLDEKENLVEMYQAYKTWEETGISKPLWKR